MLILGALSYTVALLPVIIALLFLPFGVSMVATLVAENTPGGNLKWPQNYLYCVFWLIATLAVAGISYVGQSYFSELLVIIYAGVGLSFALVGLIIIVVALEKQRQPTNF